MPNTYTSLSNDRDDTVARVEAFAAAAWPAGLVEHRDGWLLRHTSKVLRRRSNSALPPAADRHPERTISTVENFYARFGRPAMVQVGPSTAHTVLDAALAERGYRREAETQVWTADINTAIDATAPHPGAAIDSGMSPSWRAAYIAHNNPDSAAVCEKVLAAITPPVGFAAVTVDGELAGLGLFVVAQEWAGVFAMTTMPPFRRQGIAGAVLHTGARWAAGHGASGLYLQVTQENLAAHGLYSGVGFTASHGYHYRVAPPA